MRHGHFYSPGFRSHCAVLLLAGIAPLAFPAHAQEKAGAADLGIKLVDSPNPVSPSGLLTYTITLTNNGPAAAVNVSMSMPLPSETTFTSATSPAGWTTITPFVGGTGTVICAKASMADQEEAEFVIVVFLNDMASGSVQASASCESATSDTNPGNDSDSEQTKIDSATDLVVSMDASPNSVEPYDMLTYDISITNDGPRTAFNVEGVMLTPPNTRFISLTSPPGWTVSTPAVVGSGALFFAKPQMATEEAAQFKAIVLVIEDAVDTIDATASFTSITPESSPGDESVRVTTSVKGPCILTVKRPDGGELWQIGSTKEIKWTGATGCCSKVRIQLLQGGLPIKKIVKETDNDGSFNWNINPDKFVPGNDYSIRVKCVKGSNAFDDSDNTFSLTP